MTSHELVVRGQEANEFISSIEDPIGKALAEIALSKFVGRLVKHTSTTDEEYQQQLPQAPFDVFFYLTLVHEIFSMRQRLFRILEGDLDAAHDFPID
jgi:hypothetical protein